MAELRHSHTVNALHVAFVKAYLENGNNASKAYKTAYPDARGTPKDISARASRLLKSNSIQGALVEAAFAADRVIDRVVAKYEITAERVAEELALLAFTRIGQLADVIREADHNGKQRLAVHVKPFAECDQDALAAIVEVKRTAGGEVSVKLADKRAALMDIARLKGWIADKPIDNRQLVMLKIER